MEKTKELNRRIDETIKMVKDYNAKYHAWNGDIERKIVFILEKQKRNNIRNAKTMLIGAVAIIVSLINMSISLLLMMQHLQL